jgi:hypothetical protein
LDLEKFVSNPKKITRGTLLNRLHVAVHGNLFGSHSRASKLSFVDLDPEKLGIEF